MTIAKKDSILLYQIPAPSRFPDLTAAAAKPIESGSMKVTVVISDCDRTRCDCIFS